MDIGISKIIPTNTSYSTESYLSLELNYRIAEDECRDAIKEGVAIYNVIDNVMSLNDVANRYGSSEAFAVVKDLIGKQAIGISMEGFLKNAWDKLVAWIKKMWSKFTNFILSLWAKIKRLFSRKKATSRAAAKFAQKHPEAAKAVDTPAADKAKSGGAKTEETAKHDTPAQVAEICAAAPSVPVPAKAKAAIKIPNPKAVSVFADLLKKDVDTVLKNMENAISTCAHWADKAAENAEKGDWYKTEAEYFTRLLRTQSIPEAMKLYGGEKIKDLVTNPRARLEKIQMESPTKLGDISAAIKGYEAALDKMRPVIETLNKEKTRMENAYSGMRKIAEKLSTGANQLAAESQHKMTAVMGKCLGIISGIFNAVTSTSSWLVSISNGLATKEAMILDVEETERRNEGMNDEI